MYYSKWRYVLGIVILIIGLIFYGFGTKSELFECDVAKDICQITATNWYNQQKIKTLPSPRLYKDIKIQRSRKHEYRSHRRSRYVDVYYLYYELLDGNKGRFFEKDFRSKADAEAVVEELKQAFKNSSGHIRYEL